MLRSFLVPGVLALHVCLSGLLTGCGKKAAPNYSPTISSSAATSANEGVAYRYTVSCTDQNSDHLAITRGAADSCNGTLSDNGDGTAVYAFTPDENQGSTDCILDIVCADSALTAGERAVIAINETNQPPVIGNLPAAEGGHWNAADKFKAEATDGDIPVHDLTWSLSSHNCTFTPAVAASNGEVSWTCQGVETCKAQIMVTDNGTPVKSDTKTLTIDCINTAPEITSVAVNSASEGENYTYNITCTDADGDALTLGRGTGDSCGGTVTDNGNGTGTYAVTLAENLGGSQCTVMITCSDSQYTVRQTSPVMVSDNNLTPSITNLPATEEGHWGQADRYEVKATDGDLPADTLTWSIENDTCSFTPVVVASTGEVSWNCGGVENCSAELKVSDSGTPALTDSKTLTIRCANAAPVVGSLGGTSASEGALYSYSVTCTDGDSDTLTLKKDAQDSCKGNLVDDGNGRGTYSFTPAETQGGAPCKVAFTCTDTQATVLQTTEVQVAEVNLAPKIGNLPASKSGHWGQADSFEAKATDDDLPANTLSWSLVGHNCPFAPSVNESSGKVDWLCQGVGACTVDVKVADDGSPTLSETKRLSISCNNTAPRINSQAANTAAEGTAFGYAINCTDGDGDKLTLAKGPLDTCGGTVVDNKDGTGLYDWTPGENQGGTWCYVQITCSDTQSTLSQKTQVTVGEVNRAPVIGNLPATQSGHWGQPGLFAAQVTDPDLPANALAWSLAGNSCTFALNLNTQTGVVDWTCGGVETCTVDLKVTDNGAPNMSDTRKLTISCINSAIQITSQASASAMESAAYRYDVTCTDADQDPLTLNKGAGDSCGGTLVDQGGGKGVYSFTPDESQGGGSCHIAVECSDTQASITQTSTVSVAEDNKQPDFPNLPATKKVHWGKAGKFTALVSDPDLPVNTLAISLAGHSCSFTPALEASTGEVSWSCGNVETCTVDLKVVDNGAPTQSETEQLTIACDNTAPLFTTEAPNRAREREVYLYNIICTDADGDALTLSKGKGDTCTGALQSEGGVGQYSFTPGEEQGGKQCVLEITCGDTQNSVTEKVTIAIEEDNQAPVITNLPGSESGHWGHADSFNVAATDADLPANTLQWSLSDNTCSFTPLVNLMTGKVSWTCSDAQSCTVKVAITDNGIPVKSDAKLLTINCTNSAPVFGSTAGTSVVENQVYSYDIACTDSDGDTLKLFKGAGDTCAGSLADNGNGTGTYTFSPDESKGGSTCNVEVICSDTQAHPAQKTMVTIEDDNRAPVITNLPATESGHWGQGESFNVEAEDPDLPVNTLVWSLSDNTCAFTPAVNTSTGAVSWTCGNVTDCSVKVTVTDSGDPRLSDSKTLGIKCTNQAPAFTSNAPLTVEENNLYLYDVSCADPDNDVLTLSKGGGDDCGGNLVDHGNGTGRYSFTPGETKGGTTCKLQIQCTDTQDTLIQNATLSITEDNLAPVITNLPATEMRHWGKTGSYAAAATDADVPANELNWSLSENTCAFTPVVAASTGEVSWTCGDVQNCSVKVTVTDNGQPAKSVNQVLSLQCVNAAPLFYSSAPTEATEGAVYLYQIRCSDPDGDGVTLARADGDTCGGIVFDDGGGRGRYIYTPGPGSGGSQCVVKVRCEDTQDTALQSTSLQIRSVRVMDFVTAGSTHSCGLYNGELHCWGHNEHGQLGLGDIDDRDAPTRVGEGSGWQNVTGGASHSCGIMAGRLHCWGLNWNGQLGLGDGSNRSQPVQVGGEMNWQRVSAGGAHSCAIRAGGLYCWGKNDVGQLGLGDLIDRSVPERVGLRSDWQYVSTGLSYTCGIRAGELHCWGENGDGQLGLGDSTDRMVPAMVGTATNWRNISLFERHTCGIRDGELYCWGLNDIGQLGHGDTVPRNTPARVGAGTDWQQVAVGERSACGIRGNKLYCFGANETGQLGLGDTLVRQAPEQVGSATDWLQVVAGSVHALARRSGGRLYAWGSSGYGQPGLGFGGYEPRPGMAGHDRGWSFGDVGGKHTCGIIDGRLYCFGHDEFGQLGLGTSKSYQIDPRQVGSEMDWQWVAAGRGHSCGIRSGALYCFGGNGSGQLGVGDRADRTVPTPVLPGSNKSFVPQSDWTLVTAGGAHSCAIRRGLLYCFGGNGSGQLGVGDNLDRTEPARVMSDSAKAEPESDWRVVSAGGQHTCAIRSGLLYCFGANGSGQLGLGDTIPRNTPKRVGEYSDWEQVFAGGQHTCAIRGGQLYCFGANGSGQLGLGDTSSRHVPVMVGGHSDWSQATTGGAHSCGLRNGALYCFGANDHGQLGLGDLDNRQTPIQVGSATSWQAVVAGLFHSCAKSSDDNIRCFGRNDFGQLSYLGRGPRNIPIPLASP